ncbi:MAG: DUF1211 domain-containing protein [Solirubrobacterales bacterium]|nr:DUF1211 domain-containing protein [Solirubrobacterales bacterium]MCB0860831.1 DUF1211 domain-containing protein [Solirubrobacterales bacterium]
MAEADEHADLPSLERGRDLSRIYAFTDGVFAIAITLLVLQIEVPSGLTSNSQFLDALNDLVPDFFAFAISFLVIGSYWIRHHRLMRMVREYDQTLMAVTMFYLAWVVLLPFSSQLIGEYGSEVTLTTVFYILNLALIGASLTLTIRVIVKHRLSDPKYEWELESGFKSSAFVSGIFLLTAPIGLVLGGWTPLLWIVLMRLDPFERERKRVAEKGGKPERG